MKNIIAAIIIAAAVVIAGIFIGNSANRNNSIAQITPEKVYGDKVYFTVKCKVIEDPHDLLVDTVGTLVAKIKQ